MGFEPYDLCDTGAVLSPTDLSLNQLGPGHFKYVPLGGEECN